LKELLKLVSKIPAEVAGGKFTELSSGDSGVLVVKSSHPTNAIAKIS
jgi:hypothetical protein